jgi:methyl-accepting chemotaxis protein
MAEDHVSMSSHGKTVRAFVKGYNKSVVLNSLTRESMGIIAYSLDTIGESLSAIVAAFEEMRATSEATAANTGQIDGMMDRIVQDNQTTGEDIELRMKDLEAANEGSVRLSGLFGGLADKARKIETLTGSIRDVSDRTNILAINASIEAARAGTVGKGFRIIANEVRTLAGQTNDFAQNIEGSIAEFDAMVKDISTELYRFTDLLKTFRESFGKVLDSFAGNARSIDEAGRFLGGIAASTKEESQALNAGLDSLEGISGSLKDTRVVIAALMKSYSALDTLMDKEELR